MTGETVRKGFIDPGMLKIIVLIVIAGGALYLLLPVLAGLVNYTTNSGNSQIGTGDSGVSGSGSSGSGGNSVQSGPIVTEKNSKETNGIATPTEPVSTSNSLKLVKTFGPTKLPEYGAKQGSGSSVGPVAQLVDFNINGITGKISMDSYRTVNGKIQGNGKNQPLIAIVKALDTNGKEISCEIDTETNECYFHKIALSGLGYYQASSSQTSNAKSITQWEVLIFTK